MFSPQKPGQGGMPYSKILRINEIIWLIFVILSAIISVYYLIKKDTDMSLYFGVLVLFSGVFYSIKKGMRKKFQRKEQEQEKGSK